MWRDIWHELGQPTVSQQGFWLRAPGAIRTARRPRLGALIGGEVLRRARVMVAAFSPLELGEVGRAVGDGVYVLSWIRSRSQSGS
jgi:hypothetical protein